MGVEYIKSDRSYSTIGEADGARIGDYLFIKNQLGWNVSGDIKSPADFKAQFEQSYENVSTAVTAAGGSLSDVVRVRYPFLDGRNYITCRQVRHSIWPKDGPATSVVVAYGLSDPRAIASVEAVAYLGDDKEVFQWSEDFAGRDTTSDYSPEVRGKVGFSPAIRGGKLAFLAGQTALDPNDRYVHLGDPDGQTRYTHENNIRVMNLLGAKDRNVVRLFHFGPYSEYFDIVRRVTAEYFPQEPPSSSVAAAIGWPGNIVESEVTAYLGSDVEYSGSAGYIADGASAASRAGQLIFTSGIVGRTVKGDLVGPADGRAQFTQAFSNLQDVLTQAGSSASSIVMLNVYVAATTLLPVWEEAKADFRAKYLSAGQLFPPYSAIAVTALPSFENLIQMEAVAAVE